MASIPVEHALAVAAVLFAIGLAGVLMRRNIVFMLLSIEIMLNAGGLAFIVAGSRWQQPDGQVMYFFILTMAAAEVSVGLAMVLQLYHRFGTLDVDAANKMNDLLRQEGARALPISECLMPNEKHSEM